MGSSVLNATLNLARRGWKTLEIPLEMGSEDTRSIDVRAAVKPTELNQPIKSSNEIRTWDMMKIIQVGQQMGVTNEDVSRDTDGDGGNTGRTGRTPPRGIGVTAHNSGH